MYFCFICQNLWPFETNSCPFPWHWRLVDCCIKPPYSLKWNLVASALLQQTFCTSTHQLHALKFKSTTFSLLEFILHCTMWRIAQFLDFFLNIRKLIVARVLFSVILFPYVHTSIFYFIANIHSASYFKHS